MTNDTLRRLVRYLAPHKKDILLAFLLLAVGTAAQVAGPQLVRVFISDYLAPRYFPRVPLEMLVGGFALLTVVGAVATYLQLYMFQTVALKIVQQLRMDVFSKVQDLGLAFFDKTPGGSLISRITNDTEAVKDLYMSVLSSFVQNIIFMVGIFIGLFWLNPHLALYYLVLIPLIYLMMSTYRRVSGPVFHAARHQLSRLNAKMSESLQGMYVIQAMRQERRMRREFGAINETHYQARFKNIKFNGLLLRPLVDVVYLGSIIGVLNYYGVLSLNAASAVDIGVVYVFVEYLQRMFEPVNDMMQRLNMFQQATVSAERVFRLLDEAELAPDQEPAVLAAHAAGGADAEPRITTGRVEFDDVTFSYDGETDVLKHISFVAEPGQTVALVGHTGSGKSSIVSLLLRFYRVEHGEIRIDGVPLKALTDRELRSKIGLVLQDPFVFVGDVKRNIRLGNESISDEQVVEAARFVQADPFIAKLPHGYDEAVGERGATFSGGQRQLLSFARTMAIQPKILVLDEATASIDTETEEAIQEALQRMRRGRTTIAIAHRLSTIQDADLILVLHHGEIVERGTHQQLLAQHGLYHKMFLLQQGAGAADAAG